MATWTNLCNAVKREILSTAARGPTQEEVQNRARWDAEARMDRKRQAAELEDVIAAASLNTAV